MKNICKKTAAPGTGHEGVCCRECEEALGAPSGTETSDRSL